MLQAAPAAVLRAAGLPTGPPFPSSPFVSRGRLVGIRSEAAKGHVRMLTLGAVGRVDAGGLQLARRQSRSRRGVPPYGRMRRIRTGLTAASPAAPALVVLWFGFNSGGFFPVAPAVAAIVLAL